MGFRPLDVVCAICKRPVDKFMILRNELTNSWKFRAECHGEVEECEVGTEFFASIEDYSQMRCEAFVTRDLPEPQLKIGENLE